MAVDLGLDTLREMSVRFSSPPSLPLNDRMRGGGLGLGEGVEELLGGGGE